MQPPEIPATELAYFDPGDGRRIGYRLREPKPAPGGVPLTTRLAERLGVRPGDSVSAELLEGKRVRAELRVTGTVRARVVVNCAGRTRSIIGARVLQRMALPNVISLKNGTSGWVLAGFELVLREGVRPLGAPAGIAIDSAGRLLMVEDRHRTMLMLARETP